MRKKRRPEKIFLTYGVKSPLLFYIYLGTFVSIFLILSSRLQLEERLTCEALIYGNKVKIPCETELCLSDDKIYIYTDKNQGVFSFDIAEKAYRDGAIYLTLSEDQDDISGDAVAEIVTGKSTLLKKIFMKAGT